jgi:hypothetical protein
MRLHVAEEGDAFKEVNGGIEIWVNGNGFCQDLEASF